MNNVGKVIRHYRKELNMTIEELCEGICSKKYIYMIEKGERTPSILIMDQIFTRLNIPIDDYSMFIFSDDPIGLKKIVDGINYATVKQDYDYLEQVLKDGKNHVLSDTYPFNIYLTTAEALIMFFKYRKIDETKVFIETNYSELIEFDELKDIDKLSSPCIRVLNLYAILQLEKGMHKEGLNTLSMLKEYLKNHNKVKNFSLHYILVSINELNFHFKYDDYEKAFALADELYKYMLKHNEIERLPFVLSILGYIHIRNDNNTKGKSLIIASRTLSEIQDNEFLVEYIEKMNKRLWTEFKVSI
jgi:transcriptional regulator with XRE-family HTH domain